jgi:hypothetical protein
MSQFPLLLCRAFRLQLKAPLPARAAP